MAKRQSFVQPDSVQAVMQDAQASDWLKRNTYLLLHEDPIQAANDAEKLSKLMRERVNRLCFTDFQQPSQIRLRLV